MKRFKSKRAIQSGTFKQTPVWKRWQEIQNVGMDLARGAQILLTVRSGEYDLLARFR